MSKDYYKILGVEKGVSKDDLKRAFRKLAHEHHPDKGGDEAKFKEINEAYQVLSDDQKRAQYDQFGSNFQGAGGFPGGGFGGGQGFNVNFEDLGDIFGDMFGGFGGGGRGRSRTARGNDILVDVQLSFKEAIFGLEKEIEISKENNCNRCSGIGAEPGSSMKTCGECEGNGFVTSVQRTILGAMQAKRTCSNCQGSGEIPETVCSNCKGSGTEYGKKKIRVDIPPGVEDGVRIRVRGQGESIGSKGESGDLYLQLHVERDDRFEREGRDLYSVKKIGFTQAALGDEVTVETVDGNVKLKVPAGTQNEDRLRLKGKGVPSGRSRGDQYVIMQVVTPEKLSKKQKKLLEELDLVE